MAAGSRTRHLTGDAAVWIVALEIAVISFIACYCGISLPVAGIGLAGKASSPLVADTMLALVIATMAVAALVFELRVSGKK